MIVRRLRRLATGSFGGIDFENSFVKTIFKINASKDPILPSLRGNRIMNFKENKS